LPSGKLLHHVLINWWWLCVWLHGESNLQLNYLDSTVVQLLLLSLVSGDDMDVVILFAWYCCTIILYGW
jgi:hypothetical protein